MLRHGRAIGPPTSVTVLPLPHDHRVSVLLPLGAHPLTRRPPRPPAPCPPRPVPSQRNFTRTRDIHSQRSGSVGTFSSFPTVTCDARPIVANRKLTNGESIRTFPSFLVARANTRRSPRTRDCETKTRRRGNPGFLSRERGRGRGEKRSTRTSMRTLARTEGRRTRKMPSRTVNARQMNRFDRSTRSISERSRESSRLRASSGRRETYSYPGRPMVSGRPRPNLRLT